jgi:hypothetical protein
LAQATAAAFVGVRRASEGAVALGGAASQIFGAIKDAIMEAWDELPMSLSVSTSSISNKLTEARGQVYDQLNV